MSAHSPQNRSQTKSLPTSAALAALGLTGGVHAAADETLKVGLIGCGGRGTGAASQALRADRNVKLTAMADAFEDRLLSSLATLKNDENIVAKIDVPRERQFTGFDGYKKVIESGVDVVLLCTPPGFRPLHLKAAVEAGKHIFAEKPVAVDAPGVRSVLETCAKAKQKGLSVVSGLCLRYDNGFRDTVKRIHDGAVGDVLALQANDLRGRIWVKDRKQEWSDMEYQMRNWYYFTWLCGDFNVEQHVHYLDVCAWLMKETYPVRATGLGGRQVRTGPEYGHIFDHHAVCYEFANGARLHSQCRQQVGCANDMSAHVVGTRGTAMVAERELSIAAAQKWRYGGPKNDMYQTEHDELFAAIRAGKPINNGEYMSNSTLLAIMGRMATYTGKAITWDMAMNSKEDLSPAKYEWGPMPMPEVAKPGVTKFI
jgi:predicted dehydrogenase